MSNDKETGWGITLHCPPKYNIPILLLLLVVLVWAIVPTRKAGAEMFPSPPMMFDLSRDGEPYRIKYFEYKDKYCFVGSTKWVTTLQCGKL